MWRDFLGYCVFRGLRACEERQSSEKGGKEQSNKEGPDLVSVTGQDEIEERLKGLFLKLNIT